MDRLPLRALHRRGAARCFRGASRCPPADGAGDPSYHPTATAPLPPSRSFKMPCSYCDDTSYKHNIRTCKKHDADKIAEMLASGMAKSAIFTALDIVPGVGRAFSVINTVYSLYNQIGGLQSKTKNERKRAAMGIIYGAC